MTIYQKKLIKIIPKVFNFTSRIGSYELVKEGQK